MTEQKSHIMSSDELRELSISERQNLPRYRSSDLSDFNEEARTVTMSFASETPVVDWWGDAEILRCTPENMDTGRFEAGVMPILFNHDRDQCIGFPQRIWCEDGKAYAEIKFANTEKANEVMQLVKDGLRGVSVGYQVTQWTLVESGAKTADGIEGPAWIAERWEVFEASIVTVPADATVGIGRSLQYINLAVDKPENESEEVRMGENNQVLTPEAAQKAERERCTAINAVCAAHKIDDAKRDAWLNDGVSIETVNREVLSMLAERNKPVAVPVETVADEMDKIRAAYTDAMAMRAGLKVATPAPGAAELRGVSAKDMARDLLIRRGETGVFRMDDRELMKRAMGTGTFSEILDATVRIAMSQGYNEAVTTFEAFTTEGSASDFKANYKYRLGGAAEPELIPENGEFTHIDFGKEKVAVQLSTDGLAWSYTRQLFVNDDMDVLSKIPARVAAAFKRKINRLVYEALVGITYSAARKNLGTAGALSTATISEARKLLRNQKDFSNKYSLNLAPKFLIVPTALETDAEKLVASIADPTGSHSGIANVFRNGLDIVCDAALDDAHAAKGINTNAYYVAAEKNQVDGIEVSYLNGNKNPILEAQDDFDTLGRKYRMYLDFTVDVLDFRGYVKNANV